MLRRCTCSRRIPSPYRGIREDKIRLSVVVFLKEDCKGGAIREGLMTGLLILSVHQKHQRVLETLGWKSGASLELLLVLYETGD